MEYDFHSAAWATFLKEWIMYGERSFVLGSFDSLQNANAVQCYTVVQISH